MTTPTVRLAARAKVATATVGARVVITADRGTTATATTVATVGVGRPAPTVSVSG